VSGQRTFGDATAGSVVDPNADTSPYPRSLRRDTIIASED
jgi:hypothetical protein